MSIAPETLINLTADIVSAHVSNNSVSTGDLPHLIQSVHAALAAAQNPPMPALEDKPQGAVSARASVKRDYLVSMIDGKRYKMLRRHLNQNGYTPESYREAFGLPKDYPMVAASYAETRRDLAKQIGLGRKPRSPKEPVATPAKKPRGRKPKVQAEA